MFVCVSACLPVCLSICLSVYLSIYFIFTYTCTQAHTDTGIERMYIEHTQRHECIYKIKVSQTQSARARRYDTDEAFFEMLASARLQVARIHDRYAS